MKYLLSEEEFQALVPRKDLLDMESAMRRIRWYILKMTNHTCIYNPNVKIDIRTMGAYCDDCPISDIAITPSFPEYSTESDKRDDVKLEDWVSRLVMYGSADI